MLSNPIAEALRRLARVEEDHREAITDIRNLLAAAGGVPADDQDGPIMVPNRRAVRMGGLEARLTRSSFKLLEALSGHVGEELDFGRIDAIVRPGTKPWCGVSAIRQMVARLRKQLRSGGLDALAAAIQPGYCRSYVLYRCWPMSSSNNVTRGHRRRHTPAATLVRSNGANRKG